MTLPDSTCGRSDTSTRVAAALLVVAGFGHAVEIGHHGALFGAVGAAQLVGAFVLVRRPTTQRRALAVVALLALVCLWAFSRTVGLPFGPHAGHAEAIGLIDAPTITAQLAAVVALVPSRRRVLSSAFATTLVALVAVVTMVPVGNADTSEPASHHGPTDIGLHDDDGAHTHP